MAMNPNIDLMMEQSLTAQEMAVRDFFVDEYMKDHDPYRACIRIGFLSTFASDQAKVFMQDGYVLRKIAYMQQQAMVPNEGDKAAMLENLRYLAHNGTPASRASATKLYMEAQGYISNGEGAEEARATALIDALANFAQQAPA